MRRLLRCGIGLLAVMLAVSGRARRYDSFRRHPAADRARRDDRHAADAGHPVRGGEGQRRRRRARQQDRDPVRGQSGEAGPVDPQLQQAGRPAEGAGDLHRVIPGRRWRWRRWRRARRSCWSMPAPRPTSWPPRRRIWSTRFRPSAMRSRCFSKYLVGEGKKRGAILFENDAAGIAGRDDFVKYFPEAGGTILAQEPTQFGQTDFRPGAAETGRRQTRRDAGVDHRRPAANGAAIQAAWAEFHRRRNDVLRRSGHHRRPRVRRVSSTPRCGSMRRPNWRPNSRRSTARTWSSSSASTTTRSRSC